MRERSLRLRVAVVLCLAWALGGCETTGPGAPFASAGPPLMTPVAPFTGADPPTNLTVQAPGDVQYYPSDEPLRLGIEHFNRGHYGLAERYFRDATEKAPRDPTAWVGLAASYDRLARFDLADRAYKSAIRLVGETTQILNNEGYSYILRGNLVAARGKLLKAYENDPTNPTVINNLALLNSSYKYIERAPEVTSQ